MYSLYVADKLCRGQRRASQSPPSEVNLDTVTTDEARAIQSEEQKTLGYRPPSDSLAAKVQSAVDSRADEPVCRILYPIT